MVADCLMTEDCPGYDRERGTCLISPGDCPFSPRLWCECRDAPIFAGAPATFLDHASGCEYPTGVCTVRAHRVKVHDKCGRELVMRFCGCMPSGYTLDTERGWWVHYSCGWPTHAWYEAEGKPAPESLLGVRPVTLHEYVSVHRGPKKKPDPLTPEQRLLNDARIGGWVRD